MKIAVAEGLRKIYKTGEATTRALDGVDLEIAEGEFLAIVGSSGSGKSTLLNMLGGLDRPTSGSVKIRDSELSKMDPDALTIFRRRNIGFVFQSFNLIPVLSVYENIILPLKLDGVRAEPDFLAMIIESLGLTQKKYQMPNTLSGGQQQRAAIARALASRPALILADEPTGSLDSRTGMEVMGLMKVMSKRLHQTLVVVTHNEAAAQMSDRIVRMEDGKLSAGERSGL